MNTVKIPVQPKQTLTSPLNESIKLKSNPILAKLNKTKSINTFPLNGNTNRNKGQINSYWKKGKKKRRLDIIKLRRQRYTTKLFDLKREKRKLQKLYRFNGLHFIKRTKPFRIAKVITKKKVEIVVQKRRKRIVKIKFKRLRTLPTSIVCGKKSKIETVLKKTLCLLHKRFPKKNLLKRGLKNLRPLCDLRKMKIKKVWVSIPIIIKKKRSKLMGIKWLLKTILENKKRNKTSFSFLLAKELYLAYKKKGNAYKKKLTHYKTADTNKQHARKKRW